MSNGAEVDRALIQWGERLFYPSNRMVRSGDTARLGAPMSRRAAAIRQRIEATVRRAPQVMVKVTGGGRGMGAIRAHLRYICKNGRLEITDDRGVTLTGKDALHDIADQWRYGGSPINEVSPRREAFNIMLSMPAGTNADLLKKAAQEFASAELSGHRYVMVLHEHQANPHVHLSVKAESTTGKRLNPRKADLHRWRETFAEKLRGWGIEAEATRQASRGEVRNFNPLWRVKAKDDGRLREFSELTKADGGSAMSRAEAAKSWAHIMRTLAGSDTRQDRELAQRISNFVRAMPVVRQPLTEAERLLALRQVDSRHVAPKVACREIPLRDHER